MSQQPSGWYDDPSNPDMLRYWDGVTWTNHTAPRKSPTLGADAGGPAAAPASGAASSGSPGSPGRPVAPTPMPQGGFPEQHEQPGQPTQPSQQQLPQQQYPYQQAPQYPGTPQGNQWMYAVKTTADGVPLATWGRRLAAWLVDGVILLIGSVILVRIFVPDYADTIQRFVDATAAQDQSAMENLLGEVTSQAVRVGIVTWVFISLYCIAFWTTLAQTPGKMVLGISVRRTDRSGPLDLATALKRRLISVIQIVPLVSGVYFIVFLLDYLWPLWDDKRQALHDKVAGTQVVVGKQPRNPG
jgi:uncharacterized RDD family membrane protein YckC